MRRRFRQQSLSLVEVSVLHFGRWRHIIIRSCLMKDFC